ncbi:PRC-barrel domain-containing protein [Actinacidiphila epipremni]|uniref:PRC-barrel domain containing protein n=1 Tax=Actinacidiphila epipremni TaxID=2053013 RepID=A0ABX0ZL07_9ACTN|nr:PRC-barrel domain-containing protein [Actinacidiphila epipremni]NJP43725.1 PRC-barrel domain containing protein [Actinacidiphila epipremni]
MQTDIDPRSLIGRRAVDRDGTKIGTVDEVYLDDATGTPEWAAVRTGLFTRDAFVPLEPSELVGDALRVPYKKSVIRDAPDFGVGRHLSPEQELQLYHHYGMDVPTAAAPGGGPGAAGPRDFGEGAPREFGELPPERRRPEDQG